MNRLSRIAVRSVLVRGVVVFANAWHIAGVESVRQAGRTTIFARFFLSASLLTGLTQFNDLSRPAAAGPPASRWLPFRGKRGTIPFK